MEITKLGSAIEQPDFTKIQVIPLVPGTDVSAGLAGTSYVFARAGMKGMILARLINVDDARYAFTLQQKQNGAWATHPGVPPITTITADGVTRIEFTVTQFTEIRLFVTESGGGTPVGNLYADLFI